MIILALDTTTRSGSIAVMKDAAVLALVPGDETRTHGERLPGEIARALGDAGIARTALDLLAVAIGPGAFTGLRIGLAAMQGLAMALDRPVAGVSALDALARQAAGDPAAFAKAPARQAEFIAPWMDAQRGDVFASLIRRDNGEALAPPTASNPGDLLEIWSGKIYARPTLFIGDAAVRDHDLITHAGKGFWTTKAPQPLAPQIGTIARELALAGRAGPPHALEPIYVRRPDAEIERDRRSRS